MKRKTKNILWTIAVTLSIIASLIVIGSHFGILSIVSINDIYGEEYMSQNDAQFDELNINYALNQYYDSEIFTGSKEVNLSFYNYGDYSKKNQEYHNLTINYPFTAYSKEVYFTLLGYAGMSNQQEIPSGGNYQEITKCQFNKGDIARDGLAQQCCNNGCDPGNTYASCHCSFNPDGSRDCENGGKFYYQLTFECNVYLNVTCPEDYQPCQIKNLNGGLFFIKAMKNGQCGIDKYVCSDGSCKADCNPVNNTNSTCLIGEGLCNDIPKPDYSIYIIIGVIILIFGGLAYLYLKGKNKF